MEYASAKLSGQIWGGMPKVPRYLAFLPQGNPPSFDVYESRFYAPDVSSDYIVATHRSSIWQSSDLGCIHKQSC